MSDPMNLLDVLERSKTAGFLGPGPVEEHVDHAMRFGAALPDRSLRFADLGAGGGVPALPLLCDRADLSAVLIDASQKRCSFLQWAAVELDLADRVEVWCGRAEVIGHEDRARRRFDAVVARGFGPPAATIECAAPLLVDGGIVVISEPPHRRPWPVDGLAAVGLEAVDPLPGVAVFKLTGSVPDSHPRAAKQQKRSPLFVLD